MIYTHFLAGRLEANRQLIRKITEELNIMEEVGSRSQTDEHGSQSVMGEQRPGQANASVPQRPVILGLCQTRKGKECFQRAFCGTHTTLAPEIQIRIWKPV